MGLPHRAGEYKRLGLRKEHRILMEKALGRALLPTELVHHKNEIKDDNSIGNLEIVSAAEHASLHHKPRPLCSLPGCDRPHLQHGYCAAHLRRWEKTGDPAQRWQRGDSALCIVCKAPFVRQQWHQKTCSHRCYLTQRNDRRRERYKRLRENGASVQEAMSRC